MVAGWYCLILIVCLARFQQTKAESFLVETEGKTNEKSTSNDYSLDPEKKKKKINLETFMKMTEDQVSRLQNALAKCKKQNKQKSLWGWPLAGLEVQFKAKGFTFSGCRLIHKLVITGQTEELVRRKKEIDASTLNYTCKWLTASGFGWDKNTALHFAAELNPAAVPVLLEANADPNVLNTEISCKKKCQVKSPLWFAGLKNNLKTATALCAAGADPNLGYPTPLTADFSRKFKDLVRDKCKTKPKTGAGKTKNKNKKNKNKNKNKNKRPRGPGAK